MCGGRTVCLFVLILALMGPATAQEYDIEIPSTGVPPVIDGDLDPIWSIAPIQYVATPINGTPSSDADSSGSWRVMWDADYLYVIVDVNDDTLVNDTGTTWQDDAIEFYFDGGNTKGPGTPLADDDRQYTFGWTTPDIQGTNTNTAGVDHAQVNTATGWRHEMRFPWTSLQGSAPAMGDFIGIDCFINDDDDGGDTRETQLATFATSGDHWQVPSAWGTGLLVKGSREKASGPSPEDGATDVPRDVILGWLPGQFADTHDVYFGTVLDDVSTADRANPRGVLVGQGQAAAEFDPEGLLEFGQTYYWRIDEVNAAPDNNIFAGEVWSFTTEPFAYPVTGVTAAASGAQPGLGPQNTVNGSGLNADDQHSTESSDMWMTSGAQPAWIQFEFDRVYKLHELWVWNSNQLIEAFIGFGARDVAIEYSTDGAAWTTLEGASEFARAPGDPTYTANTIVDLGGIMARFVKLTINSNWGGVAPQTGLAEVRFYYVPVQAFGPQPADGDAEADLATELTWRAGREATSHEVFFGTDSEAVAAGAVPADTVTDAGYMPPAVEFGTTYYWKVNEIGDTGTYEGDLWSFTSQEFALVDDFESYDNDENRIYESWLDGLTSGASGSQVGYDMAPFAEKVIIHGGAQSMPLMYDNSNAPFYSEAELEFDAPQDWTVAGAAELSVWARGYPPAAAVAVTETGGKMNLSGSGADIWGNSDQFTYAFKTLAGDGSIVARVASIGPGSNTWAKGGVMIRDSLGGGSTHAMMVLTANTDGAAGNGASFQYRPVANNASSNVDSGAVIAPPYWVRIERTGDTLTGSISTNGATWTQMGQTIITMDAPVYIGLAVTSHAVGEERMFQFENIATTGNVTGVWQGVVINQPQHNTPAPLYLVVEDSAGKTAMATNDTAATAADWMQWVVPMSDLAGVNFARVQKLTIGVGDKSAPTTGGTGTVFIDDIGYGRTAGD